MHNLLQSFEVNNYHLIHVICLLITSQEKLPVSQLTVNGHIAWQKVSPMHVSLKTGVICSKVKRHHTSLYLTPHTHAWLVEHSVFSLTALIGWNTRIYDFLSMLPGSLNYSQVNCIWQIFFICSINSPQCTDKNTKKKIDSNFLPRVFMYCTKKVKFHFQWGTKPQDQKMGDWEWLWQIIQSFSYCELINSPRNCTKVHCL